MERQYVVRQYIQVVWRHVHSIQYPDILCRTATHFSQSAVIQPKSVISFEVQPDASTVNPNRSLGLAWILFFRRVDFVWLLMSNSKLLRIKNKQKTPYKKQKAASSYKILPLNGLMTVLG